MRLRLPRSVASFVVCSVALLFLYVIGLGAYSQLTGLYGELPKYGQRIGDIVDGVQQKIQGLESRPTACWCPPGSAGGRGAARAEQPKRRAQRRRRRRPP
jgi:hypothetical protein